MGLEYEGLDELAVLIRQSGDHAQKHLVEHMRKEAKKMRDLARKFAPLDHGNLEEAIKVRELGGGRDSLGRFKRKSFEVYIDMDYPAFDGRDVGRYAYIMHEHLAPYGPYKLGKNSQAKQAGQSEMVGGLFLERAADEIGRGITQRMVEVLRAYY